MSDYTPGPWQLISDPSHFDTLSTIIGGVVPINEGANHALVVEVGGWNVAAQEANARLISAAPDLLAAISEIVKAADGEGWSALDAGFEAARAAIAKAEGKQMPLTNEQIGEVTEVMQDAKENQQSRKLLAELGEVTRLGVSAGGNDYAAQKGGE